MADFWVNGIVKETAPERAVFFTLACPPPHFLTVFHPNNVAYSASSVSML